LLRRILIGFLIVASSNARDQQQRGADWSCGAMHACGRLATGFSCNYETEGAMDTTQSNSPEPRRRFSREGVIGTGVSIAATGVLFLLLGLAQWMRLVTDAAVALLVIGAICVVAGVIAAMSVRKR
jgi:hypothetical protein